MTPRRAEQLRLLLIGSTVVSAAFVLVLGVPRARRWMTPRIEGVRVVSAALGDRVASAAPRETLAGTPVTLYAIVEARPRFAAAAVLYGTVDQIVLSPGEDPVPVERWSDWWQQADVLWFKVEPTYPFANDQFDPAFRSEDIAFADNYQVSWGFGWSHAADIGPSGDAYPEWPTGTMRFSARAVIRDRRDRILQRAQAPGADAVHAPQAENRPHRVTVRGSDDAFGRIEGFAGLPYVPVAGTLAPGAHPVERYVGGTVLAFWLDAQRQVGGYEGALVDWERLPEIADLVVDDMFLANDGSYYYTEDPLRRVTYEEVRAGDLLAIEDHIGVLYEDRGPGGGGDGVLNRWDRLLEAYFEPLRDTAAGDAFVSGVSVFRLRTPSSQ